MATSTNRTFQQDLENLTDMTNDMKVSTPSNSGHVELSNLFSSNCTIRPSVQQELEMFSSSCTIQPFVQEELAMFSSCTIQPSVQDELEMFSSSCTVQSSVQEELHMFSSNCRVQPSVQEELNMFSSCTLQASVQDELRMFSSGCTIQPPAHEELDMFSSSCTIGGQPLPAMSQPSTMRPYHATTSGPIFAPIAQLPLHSVPGVGQGVDSAYHQTHIPGLHNNANHHEMGGQR